MRTRRRAADVTLVVVGAYLLVLPFALSLFTRTSDAETLADRYRSFATEEGLAQFSEHTDIVVRGGQQLLDEGFPAFAAELGMSEAEFDAFVDNRFPNVAVYRERAPDVFAYLAPAVAAVASQADNVAAADDFPVEGVPVTAGPWVLLGAGAALVAAGLWAWATPGRMATAMALVAGVGLVVTPLALGWPHKVDAAEDVAEAARVAFTPDVARATTADTFMIDAAVIELREAMLPTIGTDLADFPDVSRFLRDWEAELSASAHDISLSQIQFMDEFRAADATPYAALPWLFVVPGLVVAAIAVASGGQLVARSMSIVYRRRDVDDRRPPRAAGAEP